MVMFLLSFVKGVQIRGGESISASGYGPRGSKSRGVQIRWDTGLIFYYISLNLCAILNNNRGA